MEARHCQAELERALRCPVFLDSDDLIENLSWTNAVTGALGVGFSHNEAQFDMSINPAWALNGPYLLSGAGNPMFAVLSARVNL